MGTCMRIFVAIVTALLLLASSTALWAQGENQRHDRQLLAASDTAAASASSELLEKAKQLFREKNYDEVIQTLAGKAYAEPYNFDVNILLARAQVEKCAILKSKGDPSYKTLVYQPYSTSQRLHKTMKMHPELYYIAGKCLLINNRPAKAAKTIKKALRLSPGNADYLLALGDAYSAQASFARGQTDQDRDYSSGLRAKAKGVYEEIMSLGSADEAMKATVSQKLNELSGQMQ